MRESSFIQSKLASWTALEKVLDNDTKEPDELNDLFIQVTDDLAYAQTYYPNRMVRVYLNHLGQRIFSQLSKTRQYALQSFIDFWKRDLPLEIYRARAPFLMSFAIFTISILVGIFSTLVDENFPRMILGDRYVEMTIENIEKGDPMAVYKDAEAFGMTIGITANNIMVSFWTYILGVFAGLGTFMILFRNGIMVGAFQFFFYKYGLLQESFLTIFMHGTIELSCIVIAGAAGLTMGQGLVFPGTYTRIQAFSLSARRGFRIMLGITPLIIIAGIIESYVTRKTEMPDALRLAFILLCLGFVLFYFVWYPRKVAAKNKGREAGRDRIFETKPLPYEQGEIYTLGQIFEISIRGLSKMLPKLIGWSLCFSIIILVWVELLIEMDEIRSGVLGAFDYLVGTHWYQLLVNTFLCWLLVLLLHRELYKTLGIQTIFFKISDFQALIPIAIFLGMMHSEYVFYFALVLVPILFNWIINILRRQDNPYQAFLNSLRQVLTQSIQGGILGSLLIASFLMMFSLTHSVTNLFIDEIIFVLGLDAYQISIKTLLPIFMIFFFVGVNLFFYKVFNSSIQEIMTGAFLSKKIEAIKKT